MTTWMQNSAMWWNDGNTWNKISDHNRAPIAVSVSRIESVNRMAGGTMRRYVVAKKREWALSWDNFPSRMTPVLGSAKGLGTVDGGWAGEDIERFHDNTDGAFLIRIRGGDDVGKPINDGTIEEFNVMITDFSKEITKRGIVDLWSLSITLTEV